MSSLEPVLKAYEGPDTLHFTISMPTALRPSAILIRDQRDPGGARRDRTDDLMLAKHALYQLSYGPFQEAA